MWLKHPFSFSLDFGFSMTLLITVGFNMHYSWISPFCCIFHDATVFYTFLETMVPVTRIPLILSMTLNEHMHGREIQMASLWQWKMIPVKKRNIKLKIYYIIMERTLNPKTTSSTVFIENSAFIIQVILRTCFISNYVWKISMRN